MRTIDYNTLGTQRKPPKSWEFRPVEDTGTNLFNGEFKINGYVISIKDHDYPNMPVHFLFASEAPDHSKFWDFDFAKCGDGIGCEYHGQNGHVRFCHIYFAPGEIETDVGVIDTLRRVSERRLCVELTGKSVMFDMADPALQYRAFTHFDTSRHCPVVQIDSVCEYNPPGLFKKFFAA